MKVVVNVVIMFISGGIFKLIKLFIFVVILVLNVKFLLNNGIMVLINKNVKVLVIIVDL